MSQTLAISHRIELLAAAYYLRQLRQCLGGLNDEQYAALVPVIGGSIGGHSRHMLEHYQSILDARLNGSVCFENRSRDAKIQNHRSAALDRIRDLEVAVDEWSLALVAGEVTQGSLPCLESPLLAQTSLTGNLSEVVAIKSTFSREWIYVILHAVHHLAIIATAARYQGLAVDPNLGRAPATLYFEGYPIEYREQS